MNDILPPIDLAYPHTQHSHISVWIAISNSIFVVWRHQLIVGYPYTVDIPTDVSNWYDRSHRHRSNQSLIIRTSSFFTQPKLTINQWLLICYIANLHASPALYHLLIPHGDMYLFSYVDCCIRNIPMVDCYIRCLYIFHIFQYVRWLLCIILLQSFVTASVLSSHTSSSHMLIVDLLFWYLHLNYKPIFHTQQLFIPIIWNDMLLM